MKNLTLQNITKACQGTYHGDDRLYDREVEGVVIEIGRASCRERV